MTQGTISGTISVEELPAGPIVVAACSERTPSDPPEVERQLADGEERFRLEVPPGTWWVRATLDQPHLPGSRAIVAWAHDPVSVGAGEAVDGVEVVMEVPEQVR